MSTISLTDEIFATVTLRGATLARVRINGVGSYSELLARLLSTIQGIRGMLTLDLRNSSQGWTVRRSLLVA